MGELRTDIHDVGSGSKVGPEVGGCERFLLYARWKHSTPEPFELGQPVIVSGGCCLFDCEEEVKLREVVLDRWLKCAACAGGVTACGFGSTWGEGPDISANAFCFAG